MNKIAVIGSAGAGKSTFSRRMGRKLGLEVFHLDRLMWRPGWVLVTRDEQKEIQKDLLKKERWIIDGNYSSTLDLRLKEADMVVFLDMPRLLCIYRAIKRSLIYRNRTRPDMREGCDEKIDVEFLKWIWQFPKKRKPNLLATLEGLPEEKRVVILRNRKEIAKFLDAI